MRTQPIWNHSIPPPEEEGLTNVIWSLCYTPDGQYILAAVGDAFVIFDAASGKVMDSRRGRHKGNIFYVAFAKDGARFATAGEDKQVIIWKSNFEPELKYQHKGTIMCLAFNPVTSQIFSAGSSDYALWTPDAANIFKDNVSNKVHCCAWSHDGQYIAYGTAGNNVIVRDKKRDEKCEIKKLAPVWCCEWTPITSENSESLLLVGCLDQTISFYDISGKRIGQARNIGFDPLSCSFFSNGEFFVLGGSNNKATLWSREGGYIGVIAEESTWIWSVKIKPKQNVVCIGTNDGNVSSHQINFLVVHALFQDKYISRDLLTDIVIHNMSTDAKMRIKCKELVKKVSIFKDRLVAQLQDKILVYIEDNSDMKYKLHKKITRKLDCSLMVVTSNHIVLCHEKKLQLLELGGVIEREWVFESSIRYFKTVGGPPRKEGLLVGLKNGDIFKIFIDNPFPILLLKQNIAIRCLDLSISKRKLAIVDDNSNLTVYDLVTKETLFQEMNVSSVAWNTDAEDIIAYSGGGILSIKMGSFPANTQRMPGFVVGFKGSKLFVLHQMNMSTIDVPQTTSLIKYVEKKDFAAAYRVACLGITEQDFKYLGQEALQAGDFETALKCFHRIKDLSYVDLIQKYEKEKRIGSINEAVIQAEILAYQSKFREAEKVLVAAKMYEKGVEMYTEIKRWDDATRLAEWASRDSHNTNADGDKNTTIQKQGSKLKVDMILEKQARSLEENGDFEAAAGIYLKCFKYRKSIELYGNLKKMDPLIEICRSLDKSDNLEAIQLCAHYFMKNKNHAYAKEAYLKLGDLRALMVMHIELCRWDEAFMLAKQNPGFKQMIHAPYAEYLEKNDRFEEAQREFKLAARPDLSMRIVEKLSINAIGEFRFKEAGTYYWLLALENLQQVKNAKNLVDLADIKGMSKYVENSLLADLYYAYSIIHSYIEEPFHNITESYFLKIFNAARFILGKIGTRSPVGISKIYIYYALAKVSRSLEAYRTARLAYEKLAGLKVPTEWVDEIEIGNLLIRSKPFSDKESLNPICNRCGNANAIIIENEKCTTCFHPFIRSFLSFETLPLVEFKLGKGLTHKKFIEILNSDKSTAPRTKKAKPQDDGGWTEKNYGNQQTLQIHSHGNGQVDDEESTPFLDRMNDVCEQQLTSTEYLPVSIDEEIIKSLQPDEVYFVDLTKHCPTYEIKYYKNMVPEIPLIVDKDSGRFFLLDEFEFAFLEEKKPPFSIEHDDIENANPNKEL